MRDSASGRVHKQVVSLLGFISGIADIFTGDDNILIYATDSVPAGCRLFLPPTLFSHNPSIGKHLYFLLCNTTQQHSKRTEKLLEKLVKILDAELKGRLKG